MPCELDIGHHDSLLRTGPDEENLTVWLQQSIAMVPKDADTM